MQNKKGRKKYQKLYSLKKNLKKNEQTYQETLFVYEGDLEVRLFQVTILIKNQ